MTNPFLLLASLTVTSAFAKPLPLSDPNNAGEWALVESVSDEFNGNSLDLTIASKWDPNFKFSDTPLKGVSYGKAAPVTSGSIVSKAQFKHGYLEMRCKAAFGPVSSSFWSTGVGGEIDVFEHFGNNPTTPNSAYRYHASFHDWRKGASTFGKRIWDNAHRLGFKVVDDFHTCGLEWDANSLRIYIDGRLINSGTRSSSTTSNSANPNK